ncbi:MAG: bifunctional oligoribonuclease/PAP phosphatase NrnA [Bacteroidia bacterium]|nr:bifunctional oligoribonuclease/PAP phosphatase NrnA [Bacteroidia bacterium]
MAPREIKKNISRFSTDKALRKLFENIKKIVLVAHPNPDGDAMGSTLGLYNILKENKFSPTVISPNAFPSFLQFLPGSGKVIFADKQPDLAEKKIRQSDLVTIMDFSSLKRSENLKEALTKYNKKFLIIDHHRQPDWPAQYWFWDVNSASTCELVYRLTKKLFPKYRFSKKTATCLYTGTMTDTGSFRFPSVKPSTHAMIKELMETGIKHYEIHEAVYDDFTYNRFQLMALALQKLTLAHSGKSAYVFLSLEELNRFGYMKGDTEGFVNLPLSIKGVQLSGFFMEQEGYIKISLRSKGNIDVNRIARQYMNGGGHKNAAGGKWFGSITELIQTFTEKIKI